MMNTNMTYTLDETDDAKEDDQDSVQDAQEYNPNYLNPNYQTV